MFELEATVRRSAGRSLVRGAPLLSGGGKQRRLHSLACIGVMLLREGALLRLTGSPQETSTNVAAEGLSSRAEILQQPRRILRDKILIL